MFIKNSVWGASTGLTKASRLSFESYGLEEGELVNPETGEVPSDSDIAEAAVESAVVSAAVDQMQSMNTAADIGETVAAASASIAARGSASPEEVALVQAGAAQTAAAAGASAGEIAATAQAVATESSSGWTVSTEGFKEMIKKFWQGIKDFAARVIQGIKNTFNRLWNSSARVLDAAKKLKEKFKDKKDKLKDSDAKIEKWHSFFDKLSPHNKAFDIPEAIKVYGTNVLDRANKAKEIKKEIEQICKIDTDKAKEFLDDVKLGNELSDLTNGKSDNVSKYLGKDYLGSVEPLDMGNKAVALGWCGDKNLTQVAMVNSVTMKVVAYLDKFNPKPKEVKLSIPTKLSDCSKIPEDVEKVIKAFEKFYNDESKDCYNTIDKFRKDIDTALEKADEGDNAETKNALKVLSRFFVVPQQLIRVAMEICVWLVQTSSAMVSLGNLLCDQFEDKDKKD